MVLNVRLYVSRVKKLSLQISFTDTHTSLVKPLSKTINKLCK
jgi:hypothetical protein